MTNIDQENYFSEQANAPKIVYLRLPIEKYHSQKTENPKQLAVKIEKPMEYSTEPPVKHVMTQQEQNKYFMENFLRIPNSIFRII